MMLDSFMGALVFISAIIGAGVLGAGLGLFIVLTAAWVLFGIDYFGRNGK